MREMKDSGIAWIGEIPKEWEVANFRYSGSFTKGKLPTTSNDQGKGLPIIGASEMLGKPCRIFTEEKDIPFCDRNDILILWDGANAGIIANGLSGVVSSTAVKYTCVNENTDLQYVYYMFKSVEPYFKSKVNGTTIPHMNIKYVNDIPLLLPTLSEQRLIANFLDEKCGEIDELVALQEKMIDELKAYKQSVITETVTKGLDKNVKFKDSGVEWIGEIPEHWRIVPITKYLESLVDYRGKTPNKVEDGIQLITARNIKNGVIDYELSKEYVSEEEYDDIMHRGRPQIGDVLFTTEAPLGNTANVDRIDIALAQRIIKFRPNSLLNPYFLKYWIMGDGFQQFLLTLSTGSTATGIKGSKLFMLITTLPPLSEQHSIATYLDTKCSEIDSLISIKQKKIEELKDYKKSLIYEYVTGKKQVG